MLTGVRILSLNVWGGLRSPELLDYLVELDADVYCLQEVPRAHGSSSEWLTYRDGDVELQQRADIYGELRSALPGHDGFFCPTTRGTLFDGEVPRQQEFGLATFVRASIPVIGASLDFVHGDFAGYGFGPHPRPRNAHVLRLFDYSTGRATSVAQMHGLREESGKDDTPARQVQSDALVRLLERLQRPGAGLVVCGDFNVLPDSSLLEVLAQQGLRDLVTAGEVQDTRTSFYGKPMRSADYLLVSAEVQVLDFEVVTSPEVSDHRPLLLMTG